MACNTPSIADAGGDAMVAAGLGSDVDGARGLSLIPALLGWRPL
jgi:hypothetical protein